MSPSCLSPVQATHRNDGCSLAGLWKHPIYWTPPFCPCASCSLGVHQELDDLPRSLRMMLIGTASPLRGVSTFRHQLSSCHKPSVRTSILLSCDVGLRADEPIPC